MNILIPSFCLLPQQDGMNGCPNEEDFALVSLSVSYRLVWGKEMGRLPDVWNYFFKDYIVPDELK